MKNEKKDYMLFGLLTVIILLVLAGVVQLNTVNDNLVALAGISGTLAQPTAQTATPKAATAPTVAAVPVDVPKTDKPKVELFVMSHCPYGTQIEKGIIPVVKALGTKIDFELKYVNYLMHGEKELKEQLRQYCIQKNYNSKFIQYLSAFLEAGDSAKALSAVGLTDANINACVTETDTKFKVTSSFADPQKVGWSGNYPPFDVYDAENVKYGVRGSPTLVVNGKTLGSARDAKSLLATICSAYNNKPAECNTDMSSYGNPAAGFGFATQGANAQAAGCGV
jgi:glutaredoxin